jgi:uncharacterized protein YecE (DUF72 family)
MPAVGPTTWWIGPSGWSYADWNGIVYPLRKPRGFKPLAYLARFFNAVEVNTTFYQIPAPGLTAEWPGLVPEQFRFAFKLTQTFTHQRTQFPPSEDVRAFIAATQPVRAAGKLGPLLIQFPWSFRLTPENAEWLWRVADSFPDFERFVEVRHTSWATPEGLAALRPAVGWVNIDQPRLRDCIGPTEYVSGEAAYVRLHGRNAGAWFRAKPRGADLSRAESVGARDARYDYLYSEEELREWVARLNKIAEQARQVYVFTNNHYRGQAPANALELKALLGAKPVETPPTLVQTYPRLARIAEPRGQLDLFT